MNYPTNRSVSILVIVLAVLLIAVSVAYWYKTHHEAQQPAWIATTPRTEFLYGSTGAERSAGIPYWIWLALPRLFPEYLHYPGGYAATGMSWEEGIEMPAGFSKKTVGYVRVAGNCAICHAASYRVAPDAVPELVAAIPGHTVDPQKLLTFLKQCAEDPRFNAGELLAEINLATKLSLFDKLLYRFVIVRRTRYALRNERAIFDEPLQGHRRNPYSDMPFADARLKALAEWMKRLPAPQYPLSISATLASMGKQVFAQNCGSCHSPDRAAKPKVIPLAEVGTDRSALDAWAQAAGQSDATEVLGSTRLEMARARGYQAGSLEGIWVRGPFLHNSSVPTLRHLLDAPAQRPSTFYTGNDLIVPQYVGFEWRESVQPGRREFVLYDTSKPGNSNAGHLYGTNLAVADKEALLEFMKTL